MQPQSGYRVNSSWHQMDNKPRLVGYTKPTGITLFSVKINNFNSHLGGYTSPHDTGEMMKDLHKTRQ
ncbi:hypothetical protein RvY_13884 [Ramazzottius varieornatus]|uniref:Uncharacterized protein n=1 Tax=Ramazzottius varieornatus TaxID=947166 RepID=A0A1D1VPG9_RAMVA|nr:hypothetical protein RvY_13884 [Ramazzottius varieornatus]